jgi:hypothetical protein
MQQAEYSDKKHKINMKTDGQLYLTISYTSLGFQINFGLDAMNIPLKSMSGDKETDMPVRV